jgi:glutamate synthase domain-containing protein 1
MKKEGEIRIPSGCAISGIFSKEKKNIPGDILIKAMEVMHDRSNGLGGGFAGYGIYPKYKDYYAFHIFYDSEQARSDCERICSFTSTLRNRKKFPRPKHTIFWQTVDLEILFKSDRNSAQRIRFADDRAFVVHCVMDINVNIEGAYVFSSGKIWASLKVWASRKTSERFYELERYEGYSWTSHGRYPTNTPGWWGGAHPFALLDYTIVHNGEISSYDANRREIESSDTNVRC